MSKTKKAATRKKLDSKGKILKRVEQLKKQGMTWVQINNAIFSPWGVVAQQFPDADHRKAFLQSDDAKEVHQAIATAPMPSATETPEDTSGRILVRLPKTLHAALIEEAKQEGTSLNQLIVSKLSVPLRALV